MKKLQFFLTSLSLMTIIHVAVFTNFAYAASTNTDECDMFQINLDCDLSGWMKLIIGDIVIAASLAVFLHYLSHRSNVKIEQNSKAIKSNNVAIQEILAEQQNTKIRRQTYVIQSFKNQFNVLLLCIGVISRFQNPVNVTENSKHIPLKSIEIESILQKLRNTLNLSIDVIDPLLIDQIENFISLIEQKVLRNYQNNKPINYESLKKDILLLTKRLDNDSESDSVLK